MEFLEKCVINMYDCTMDERAQAIKELEKAGHFLNGMAAIMIYIVMPN